MVDLEALTESFQKLHHQTPRLFSAPGRVNLIGEHTDYNEGFVLPMAVNRRTVVAAARNQTERIRVLSLDLDETGEFDLNAERSTGAPHWMNYVEGVARVLKDQGVSVSGANLAITSDVPRGSGLSSSAALEMSVGWALVSLAGVELDLIQLALAAQQAEHVYAGTKSGLMDQLASAFGRKDHALLIDCRSLERTLIELNLPGTAIVVCDTNVRHKLAASAYNERRAECERGIEILRQRLPGIRSLRDVSVEDLEKYQSLLPEQVASRCRHVITENERTLKAAEALRKSDIAQFGRLMTFSHQSLRDDYEVSCRELDIMVEHAMQHEGVAGARMTGGGFGGCTVNLVQRNLLESFCDFVARGYEERTGT
ncbi:MAG: galactokinase, partial [Pyrinomonadaceae bacterium]